MYRFSGYRCNPRLKLWPVVLSTLVTLVLGAFTNHWLHCISSIDYTHLRFDLMIHRRLCSNSTPSLVYGVTMHSHEFVNIGRNVVVASKSGSSWNWTNHTGDYGLVYPTKSELRGFVTPEQKPFRPHLGTLSYQVSGGPHRTTVAVYHLSIIELAPPDSWGQSGLSDYTYIVWSMIGIP